MLKETSKDSGLKRLSQLRTPATSDTRLVIESIHQVNFMFYFLGD